MKNAALLKTKAETPKTPGGISKSLLTPCRRLGLSRNWKKGVISPFNPPLPSPQEKQISDDSRKRKSLETHNSEDIQDEDTLGTPVRKVSAPQRKRSKTLLNNISKNEDKCSQPESTSENIENVISKDQSDEEDVASPVRLKSKSKSRNSIKTKFHVAETSAKDKNNINEIENPAGIDEIIATPVRLKSKSKSRNSLMTNVKEQDIEIQNFTDNSARETNKFKEKPTDFVSTPVSLKSKSKSNKISPKHSPKAKHIDTDHIISNIDNVEKENVTNTNLSDKKFSPKINTDVKENTSDTKCEKKSPNNLTKECIVVIQKKLYKNQQKLLKEDKVKEAASQALFNDSDDDIPLKTLNTEKHDPYDDDDFKSDSKQNKSKNCIKEKTKPKTTKIKEPIKLIPASQSSMDDDDFFEKKKTIIIKKTYDKVVKPSKAKSTGSITQKDIEDLKAKIEMKKKMLLAKSMTDTSDLRELIKKWQKGCQDALMELMDLMKSKCPDQNMEYSKILQSLQIPANLVGYDSDNDCFVTPEDNNIILSHIK